MEDTDLMPFGQYKGVMMQDVPARYLLEYIDVEVRRNSITGPVLDYVEENRKIIEIELKHKKS